MLVPTLLARARIIHLFSCRYQGLWELVTWFVFLRIYPETECPPISFILFKGVETGRLGFIYSLSVLKFVVFEVGLKLKGVLFFPLGLLEILLRFISHWGSEAPFWGFYVIEIHKILKVLLFFLNSSQTSGFYLLG